MKHVIIAALLVVIGCQLVESQQQRNAVMYANNRAEFHKENAETYRRLYLEAHK